MTIPDRRPRFDRSEGPQTAARPKIWVEGRQRPRFDLRAYLATSHGMAKRDLDPAIVEAVTRLQAFGAQVQRGDIRVSAGWAGRAARMIPSHHRVGNALITLSRLLADSRRVMLPEAEPDEPIAYPNLAYANPAPQTPPAPRRAGVEPTLQAIRSAIGAVPEPDLANPLPKPAPKDAASPGALNRALWAGATRVTLAVLMLFALPGGAVKAMLFHLDGGDLADWS